MKRKTTQIKIALTTSALYFILERFTSTSEFLLGTLMGISLCFYILCLLPDKTYKSLKLIKRSLI